MANGLRETIGNIGIGLLGAGGPQGTAAATSLLNQRSVLAQREAEAQRETQQQEAEAQRETQQQEQTRQLEAAQKTFDIYRTALEDPSITDPTEREVLKNQAKATGEILGIDPSAIDAIQPKPEQQGKLVRATDFNPGAPKDLFLIQNPNGNLTAVRRDSSGRTTDEVTFKTQEMEDGSLGVIAQRKGERPVFAGPLETAEGDLAPRTGVSARAGTREERLTQNQILSIEKDNLNNLQEDSKGIRTMESALNQLDAILATPADQMSGLDAKALQNTLSNLLNTSVRAQAELESFKNFGNLGQRINQTFTRFVAGRPTAATVEQAKELVNKFRNEIVNPAKVEVENFYSLRTRRQGGDPRNVVREETEKSISDMSTEELMEERRRRLSGGNIRR